jgi:membrane dipeptidase
MTPTDRGSHHRRPPNSGRDRAPPPLARAALALMLGSMAFAPARADPAVPADVRALHEGLITLDTHLDTPANFSRPGWDILDRHKISQRSLVDYPRMVDGGLDGGFFAVFTPQGPRTPAGNAAARDAALVRAMEIRTMVASHGAQFELALKAEDAAAIAGRGKRIVFMSIENSYPLEGDLTLMTTFQNLGVRLIGPIHFKDNDFGDSATDTPEWHGLSPLGRQFVAEANRLGLVVDGSHASQEVLDQMIALSKTPVILSHSGCQAIFNHPRNVDDQRLKALAASGGVIQINAMSEYMIDVPPNAARTAAMADLSKRLAAAGGDPAQQAAVRADYEAIQAKYPQPRATFDDFMEHLLHALQVAGVDHVGVGADMDGGGGVVGLEDVSDYPKITARLLAAGYSRDDIQKIWSGNVLRVMRQAEAYKASLKTPS